MFDADFRYEAETDPHAEVELVLEDPTLVATVDDGQTVAISADTVPGPVVDALAAFDAVSTIYSHQSLFTFGDFA